MSRSKCCKNKCHCKSKKNNCCHEKNVACSSFNPCTTLPTLLMLCQSGLLNNDRAYTLFLLFWLCGGVNTNSCGYKCC